MCNAFHILRYHGLHKDVSKADEEFGSVKGKSCTAASFGKIKAGMPLLRTKGDMAGDIAGENGSSFLSWWLWRGEEGGEGNFVAILPSVKAGFPPTAGEMAGKVDGIDSGMWVCWRETGWSLGSWWGSFCFWQVDAKCDKSCVRTGTVILSAVIKNWETLAAHSLNPARYFAIATASSVNWRQRYNDKYHISHLWHLSLYLAPPVEEGVGGNMMTTSGIQWFKFLAKNHTQTSLKRMFRDVPIEEIKMKRKINCSWWNLLYSRLCVGFSTKESKGCNLKIVIIAKQRSTQFSPNLLALKSH